MLIHASKNGHYKIVQYLVGKGANINAVEKNIINIFIIPDNSSLMHAAREGYYDIVKYLVDKKAEIKKINNEIDIFIRCMDFVHFCLHHVKGI